MTNPEIKTFKIIGWPDNDKEYVDINDYNKLKEQHNKILRSLLEDVEERKKNFTLQLSNKNSCEEIVKQVTGRVLELRYLEKTIREALEQ